MFLREGNYVHPPQCSAVNTIIIISYYSFLQEVHGEKALWVGHVPPSVWPLISTRELLDG
jgi:hypothetical protein